MNSKNTKKKIYYDELNDFSGFNILLTKKPIFVSLLQEIYHVYIQQHCRKTAVHCAKLL